MNIRIGLAALASLTVAVTASAGVEWTFAGRKNNSLEKILSRQTGTNAVKKAGANTLVFHTSSKDKFVESLNLDFKGMHPHGYYMVKRGNDIALVGVEGGRGGLYAYMDFLKRFTGYRSFGGGKFGEIVPKIDKLDLPAEFTIREEPSVASVWVAGDAYYDEAFSRSWRRVDSVKSVSGRPVDEYQYFYALNGDRMAPSCYTHVAADYLRARYEKERFATYWQELYPESMIFDAGRQYVVNELLWNMKADVEKLLDDYHTSMFGPAAKAMRKFSDVCEEAFRDNPERKATDFFAEYKNPLQFNGYTFARLAACDAALKEAAAAAKPGSVEAWRISLVTKVWAAMRPLMDAWQCKRALATAEDPEEILRLARQAFAAIETFKCAKLSPEDEHDAFYGAQGDAFLRWKAQTEKEFAPLPPLEAALDGAYARLVKKAGEEKAKALFAPIAELREAAHRKPPESVVTVTLTFDDQTKDQLKAAALLEKYGWRGCFNIITDSVAKNPKRMTWDDIRDLKRRGHEIASHTAAHNSLPKMLEEKGRDAVLADLVRSRDAIARETGSPPRFLCHPYVSWNNEVNALIREAGMTPYGHRRRILGADTKAGTPKGAGAILDRDRREGKLKVDLLSHGIEPDGSGWNPFASLDEFEAALKEIKEREKAGTVRVVSYEEFMRM